MSLLEVEIKLKAYISSLVCEKAAMYIVQFVYAREVIRFLIQIKKVRETTYRLTRYPAPCVDFDRFSISVNK